MDITTYEDSNAKNMSDSDFEQLDRLKKLFLAKLPSCKEVSTTLNEHRFETKSGILFEIEADIKAFCNLEQNTKRPWVLKKKYAGANKEIVYQLLKNRIFSIENRNFRLPESIYVVQINIIEYKGKEIAVNEIQRKSWDYILFETNEGSNHYVEFVYGSVGIYTKIHQVSDKDSEKIKQMTPQEKEVFIKKYRDKK